MPTRGLAFDESMFRALLEAAPDPIIVMAEDGRIAIVNGQTEKVLGYRRDELLGEKVEVLLPTELRSSHVANREGYVRSPHTRPMGVGLDLRARRKDGTLVPVEISLSPLETPTGKFVVSVLRDVTERKVQEAKLSAYADDLARSNSDLEQFAYVASHDLQEPLRIITGYCQLLERRYREQFDADGRKYLGYIADGSLRMQELITDLLSYSRVASKAKPLVPTATRGVVDKVLANLQLYIDENRATIECGELPTVQGDTNQLVQLFQNLIANAVKFHGATPAVIRVSAVQEDGASIFSVADNGIGFDMKYADKIFTIFQRLHSRDKYPGTGIGLAICKKVVERHGGKIWVESKPGVGSTFFFSLPMEAK